jgi:hypothetical protein
MLSEFSVKAQKGIGGVPYSFFNLGARLRWVVNPMPWPLTPGNDPLVTRLFLAPGLVWTCAENLTPTGIRSPEPQMGT